MELEKRVDRLEEDVKTLNSLPGKFDMLIELQKESNQSIKELSDSMRDNYVTKEFLDLKISNSESKTKLYIFGAIGTTIVNAILIAKDVIK